MGVNEKLLHKSTDQKLSRGADRFPRVTMTPFSVEKASEGRPWMFQSLTAVALDKNTAKLNPGVHRISSSRT